MSTVGDRAAIICRELVELVTDYLEGELDAATHARVEEHLTDCEHCREYVREMRVTAQALRETRTAQIEPARRAELLAMFRELDD